MGRTILHLDMDAFFASVEQHANPWLRGRPVFVCGNRQSRTVVATASYEARAFGVKTGMSLHEVRALCPHALLVEGTPPKYAHIFQQVAELMERYSPELERFSIDEAFVDLTGTAERFGGSLAIARALQEAVRVQFGLSCSIGIGPNKLIAKLASSWKKPHGITRITPDEVPTLLADLPIEALCGIGPAFQAALQAQGIRTCGELAQVPVQQLIAQFGRCAGLHLAQLARGIDERPVVPTDHTPPAKSMGHLHTLSHDTDDPALMRVVLLALAEKVGRRLRAEHAAGRTVTLTVRTRDFATASRARTLDRLLDDGYEIYQVGCRILADVRLSQPIRLLGLSVSQLSYHLRQIWWLPDRLTQERLLAACDVINDRFGDATLTRATLLGSPEVKRHYALKRYTTPRRGPRLPSTSLGTGGPEALARYLDSARYRVPSGSRGARGVAPDASGDRPASHRVPCSARGESFDKLRISSRQIPSAVEGRGEAESWFDCAHHDPEQAEHIEESRDDEVEPWACPSLDLARDWP